MTKRHSAIAKFTKPLSATFASISRTAIQRFEVKAQRVRLAHDIESLSAVDRHILKDIGMEGFDRWPQGLQEHALLNWSKPASKI